MSILARFSTKDLDELYKQHFPQPHTPLPAPSTPSLAPTFKRCHQTDDTSPDKITSHIDYQSHKKSCTGNINQHQDTSALLEPLPDSGLLITEDPSKNDLVADHWINLRGVPPYLGEEDSFIIKID